MPLLLEITLEVLQMHLFSRHPRLPGRRLLRPRRLCLRIHRGRSRDSGASFIHLLEGAFTFLLFFFTFLFSDLFVVNQCLIFSKSFEKTIYIFVFCRFFVFFSIYLKFNFDV